MKIYSFLIKITIVILAFYFIYRRLFIKENFDELISYFNIIYKRTDLVAIFSVFLLMLLNWSIETLKWQYLIRKIENVPFLKAFGAVLSGITVSVFTPNRIGEYAGRVFILEKADRWKGVLITILGSFSQLIVTIIFGSACLMIFFKIYSIEYFNMNYIYYGISFLLLFLVFLLISIFFNITLITSLFNRVPTRWSRIKRYFAIYKRYSKKELGIVLMMSVLRYFVFISQYYVLFYLFDIRIPFYIAFFIMSLVFVVMVAIPTFSLTELVQRGSVTLFFFKFYFEKEGINSVFFDTGVVYVSSFIWLVNIAIPALIGSLLIFRLKIFRKS